MKKVKQEVDTTFTEYLEPVHSLVAAKEGWQKMKGNKKLMRQARNRKRA